MLRKHFRLWNFTTIVSAFFLVVAATPVNATLSGFSLPVGLLYEYNFYHQFGVRASVAHDRLLKGHPRLAVSLTSSRLSALGDWNGLKNDVALFNLSWYFRPGKLIDPYAGVESGFVRFNRENDEIFASLDNRAGLFNVRAGIASSLIGGRLRPSIDGAIAIVQLVSMSSATAFPLFFSAGIAFDIAKGVKP